MRRHNARGCAPAYAYIRTGLGWCWSGEVPAAPRTRPFHGPRPARQLCLSTGRPLGARSLRAKRSARCWTTWRAPPRRPPPTAQLFTANTGAAAPRRPAGRHPWAVYIPTARFGPAAAPPAAAAPSPPRAPLPGGGRSPAHAPHAPWPPPAQARRWRDAGTIAASVGRRRHEDGTPPARELRRRTRA